MQYQASDNTELILPQIPSHPHISNTLAPLSARRYGQKIRLACNPMAFGEQPDAQGGSRPLCLFSKPVSSLHCAKFCRNQVVGCTYRSTFDTVWTVGGIGLYLLFATAYSMCQFCPMCVVYAPLIAHNNPRITTHIWKGGGHRGGRHARPLTPCSAPSSPAPFCF